MTSRDYKLSQNFLKSPRLALFLIGHSNIKKRDLVLDIGAGSGVITYALSKRAREVWAIEPDKNAAKKLRENILKQNLKNVKIIEKDFREITLPTEPYKVFSNPPFHLSSEILYKLLNVENVNGEIIEKMSENHNAPEAIYLLLQKQLALKLILTDRHYTSQLGKIFSKYYATKIKYPLKPTDFTPPPAVPVVLFEAKSFPKEPEESEY